MRQCRLDLHKVQPHTAAQAAAMSRLASQPADVLKLAMQHVPLRDRLTCCCLVSKKLHAGAVAATDALQFGSDRNSLKQLEWRTEAVTQWLAIYGQHLTSLIVDSPVSRWPVLQQLPCQNLLELKLSSCSVHLGPTADGQPGVIHGCTKLTRWICTVLLSKMV